MASCYIQHTDKLLMYLKRSTDLLTGRKSYFTCGLEYMHATTPKYLKRLAKCLKNLTTYILANLLASIMENIFSCTLHTCRGSLWSTGHTALRGVVLHYVCMHGCFSVSRWENVSSLVVRGEWESSHGQHMAPLRLEPNHRAHFCLLRCWALRTGSTSGTG